MSSDITVSKEIFSFHLIKLPLLEVPQILFRRLHNNDILGLNHSESFFTMNLGESITSATRYNLKACAVFAWWREESFLDKFLEYPHHRFFESGWHVRMRLYRRWGEITELRNAVIYPNATASDKPIVAVTLARLKLLQTARFIRWGKPVENQVRDHKGQALALAAIRPPNTFSTFSIWKNESEMINMVQGSDSFHDGESHRLAMRERIRKDFHYEFSTMRFTPIREIGSWDDKSGYTVA